MLRYPKRNIYMVAAGFSLRESKKNAAPMVPQLPIILISLNIKEIKENANRRRTRYGCV